MPRPSSATRSAASLDSEPLLFKSSTKNSVLSGDHQNHQNHDIVEPSDYSHSPSSESSPASSSTPSPLTSSYVSSYHHLISSLSSSFPSLFSSFPSLFTCLSSFSLPTDNGISLLDVKIHVFLHYLQRLLLFSLSKLDGNSICDDFRVEVSRCRLMLEKIRMMEKKIKYNMDKLIKLNEITENNSKSAGDSADPLSYRPNPSAMFEDSESEQESSDHSDTPIISSSTTYQPQKLLPSDYDRLERVNSSARRDGDRLKSRLAKSSMIKSLYNELSEAPEEVLQVGALRNHHIDEERTNYEEENFVRLLETRKDKQRKTLQRRKQMQSEEILENFEDFGDIEKMVKAVEKKTGRDREDFNGFDFQAGEGGRKRGRRDGNEGGDKKRRREFGHAPTKKFAKKKK
jgi:U3 small nucleolar ribonucleoprotein protein LCP5